MANTLHLDIVSAENEIFSGDVEFLSAPAVDGEVGILPKHTPLLCIMKPGEVHVRMVGGEEQSFYVSGGMLEVQPDIVTVLSDIAFRAEDLDEAEAKQAEERARRLLDDQHADIDHSKVRAELAEAAAQLHAISKLRSRIGS